MSHTALSPVLRAAEPAQDGVISRASPTDLTMSAGSVYSPRRTFCDSSMTSLEPSFSLLAMAPASLKYASGLKFSHATFLFCFLHSSPVQTCVSALSFLFEGVCSHNARREDR
jgi:hypothetical protein